MGKNKNPFPITGNQNLVLPSWYDPRDKHRIQKDIAQYNFLRLLRMFEYKNLPDSIPQIELEKILLSHGKAFIVRASDGDLYACFGNYSEEPGPYYNYTSTPKKPTRCRVINPYLDLDADLEIGKDCAVIRSDSLDLGVMPMLERYSTLSAENELSLYLADIESRLLSIIVSSDDKDKKAAEIYLQDLENGKLGSLVTRAFADGIQSQPYGNAAGGITQLIEYCQYLDATFDRKIGLDGNFNMKREAIVASEAALNDAGLSPYPDDMLSNRAYGCEMVNRVFGENWTVDFAGAWKEAEEMEEEETPEENPPEETETEGGGEPDATD